MSVRFVPFSKYLVRASAVLLVAMGASACSTAPDWVDPTTWIGGDDTSTSTKTADKGDDQSEYPDVTPTRPDSAPPVQTADNDQSPDLATIPERPHTAAGPDEQKDVADSLASDRKRTQYSADALKAGTEPAAAPPPDSAPPATEDLAANDNAAAAPPPPAEKDAAPAESEAAAAPEPKAAPTTQVASAAVPPPAAAPVASAAAVPAVPALSGSAMVASSDAALGFRPSSAPPLDASVAQFVPQPILARYRQTASIGPQAAVPGTQPAVSDGGAVAMESGPSTRKSRSHHAAMGMGGPETMSGAVVANFDALQGSGPSMAPGAPDGAPAAVVFFAHDTTILSASAKSQVRDAAKAFLSRGGQGYVRIIGHSSNTTGKTPPASALVRNFERSQARANAIAREMIHEGVPADKVLVEAVGDEQPVYIDTMPRGEEGNRRAEIFFQG